MITLQEIFKTAEVYWNKYKNGNTFGPDEFNYWLEVFTPTFFRGKAEEVELKFGSLPKGLYSSKLLREFRVSEDITPTAGTIDLSADLSDAYAYFISMITTAENVGRKPKVILVNDDKWESINSSYIGKPTVDYIICRINGNNLDILPSTTGEVNFTYLTFPTQPVYDYYIDADDNVVYLAAGATGVSVPAGGTSSAGVAGPTNVNSATVELEFSEDYHYEFMINLLSAMGVRSQDSQALGFANNEEQKLNQI